MGPKYLKGRQTPDTGGLVHADWPPVAIVRCHELNNLSAPFVRLHGQPEQCLLPSVLVLRQVSSRRSEFRLDLDFGCNRRRRRRSAVGNAACNSGAYRDDNGYLLQGVGLLESAEETARNRRCTASADRTANRPGDRTYHA